MQLLHSMPMAFLHWRFLFLLLTPYTWAGPASTDFLTPTLQQVIPVCAQTCLEVFIAENFVPSICGPPPNFDCLCTNNNTSGFTLGEAALVCLQSNCKDVAVSEAISVYSVCLTVPNARPNTQKTLTATISSAPYTSVPNPYDQANGDYQSSNSASSFTTSASKTQSSNTASVLTTSKLTPTSTHSTSSSSDSRSTDSPTAGIVPIPTPSASSVSSSASATAAPATASAPTLTKPQIAGVVVAGVGAAAIAFGLCFIFLLCRRRKSNRRRSGSSFGGDKVVGSEETTPDMSAIAARDFGHQHQAGLQVTPRDQSSSRRQLRLETPATSSEDGWGQYQRDMAPEGTRLAVGPRLPRPPRDEHSPITPASSRTRTSQLLPEKPSYSLFPSPQRLSSRDSIPNQLRAGTALPPPAVLPLRSPFVRAATQHPSSMDTSQAHLQGRSGPQESNDPFTSPSDPSSFSIHHNFQGSRPLPPPRSHRRDTPRFRIPSWEQPVSAGVVRKPVAGPRPSESKDVRPALPSNEPHYLAAIEDFHRRKSSKKRRNGPRPITHYTSGSGTSFENSDEEVEDVPNPRSALSPVAEVRSPPVRPPTGRVSYPAIPISASESPIRRSNPNKYPHPVRSDSLLGQRLGQEKAREISDRLQGPPRPPRINGFRESADSKILANSGPGNSETYRSPVWSQSRVKSPSTPTPWRR